MIHFLVGVLVIVMAIWVIRVGLLILAHIGDALTRRRPS